jgi:YcxB-like protein
VTVPPDHSSVDVTFDYRPWENYRVQRAIARRDGDSSLLLFLGVVFTILGVVLFFRHPLSPRTSFLHLWYVFVVPIVAFVVMPGSQILTSFGHRHPKRHPTLPHTDHTVTLFPGGVRVGCAAVKAEFPWNALLRVEERKEFILFYVAKGRALYLPKRCVTTPDGMDRVRDMIRTYAGEKAEF